MTERRPLLLLVDDNAIDRASVRRLVGRDYEFIEAPTAADGLAAARARRPDCVLLDYRLPDADGVDIVASLVALDLPIVMLSGYGNENVAVAALKEGARDYLPKDGLSADKLRSAVTRAIQVVDLERTVRAQRLALEQHVAALDARTAELEAADEATRRSEARLRALLRQLPAVVWTTDADLVVTSVAGRVAVGGEALVGQRVGAPLAGLLSDPDAEDAHRAALAGRPSRLELRHGGRCYQAHVEALRDGDNGLIGVALDVTEQRRTEEQLRYAQKMEAMGRLAGGVAHDFNNLLSVILSFAALAAEDLPKDAPQREDLGEVMQAARRGADLTRQLLAFSSRRPSEPEIVNVADAVSGMARMLRRVLGEDVDLELRPDPNLWLTRIDPTALEQVVVNLAVNARDAMPQGGRLTIEMSNVALEPEWVAARGEEAAPGEYVRVSVTDTGAGMSAEVRERIFEPFFTTKPVGRGTGLGLATVYGVARQAGGTVHVYSELGLGTTFHVYLPRADVREVPAITQKEAPDDVGGTESLLVVEDEVQLRALAVRVLAGRGYKVESASDPDEALKRLAESPVDLVVTDVVMPGMNGFELARAARELRPDQRVLLMSGYSPYVVQQRGAAEPGVPVLQKPFTPATLAAAVREALDR